MSERSFMELYKEHLDMVRHKLLLSSTELIERGYVHDEDKIFNPKVNKVYVEKFPELKKIEFGTTAYKKFEEDYFQEAHQIHVQNRHHFYSKKNNTQDVNLFDLLEAIIDISESGKQYKNLDYKKSFKAKGLYDLNLEKIIDNTVEYLNEKDR